MRLRKKKTEQLIFEPTRDMPQQVTPCLFYFDKNIKHLRTIKNMLPAKLPVIFMTLRMSPNTSIHSRAKPAIPKPLLTVSINLVLRDFQ